jgi:hypothetical protein
MICRGPVNCVENQGGPPNYIHYDYFRQARNLSLLSHQAATVLASSWAVIRLWTAVVNKERGFDTTNVNILVASPFDVPEVHFSWASSFFPKTTSCQGLNLKLVSWLDPGSDESRYIFIISTLKRGTTHHTGNDIDMSSLRVHNADNKSIRIKGW